MLDAIGLACERGARTLFRDLSFSLRGGELLRVAGANGSGKTSLLRILCGLLAPVSGEIRWQGTPIRMLGEEFALSLLYVGHAPAVKDDLTASENLLFACRVAGQDPGPEEIRAALMQFGLPERDRAVRNLSQGQRRRAALARLALAGNVPLWLLDEPFAALDAEGTGTVRDLIAGQLERGGMVVYSTHQELQLEGRVISLDA